MSSSTHHTKQKKKDPAKLIIAVLAVVAVLLAAGAITKILLSRNQGATTYERKINQEKESKDCFGEGKKYVLPDKSLQPLIKDDKVDLLSSYYKCNSVKRENIVLYNYAAGATALIVKAIPFDTIRLEKIANQEKWNIFINDKLLENSQGKPYTLNKKAHDFLDLYVQNYKGSLPENAYLALPDDPNLETVLGFISSTDFLGKVAQ